MANNSLEDWGIAIAIIVGTIVATKLISVLLKKTIKKLTDKTTTIIDDILYVSIESPFIFGATLIGFWIALHTLHLPEGYNKIIDSIYTILIILNITWFFSQLINGILGAYWKSKIEKSSQSLHSKEKSKKQLEQMFPMVKRTVNAVVWIIGCVTALSNVGINISALLGTLGVGGIALALAAQDTVKNILGSITIFTDKSFSIGDTIRVDNFEGTIIDIGVRSTKMRTYDKRIITFPNYKVADAYVINISSEPMRRVVLEFGLSYETTPDKMEKAISILEDLPNRVESVSNRDITITFSGFTNTALMIKCIYYIEKKGDVARTTSNVNFEVLKSFDQAGVIFAYPTNKILVEQGEATK